MAESAVFAGLAIAAIAATLGYLWYSIVRRRGGGAAPRPAQPTIYTNGGGLQGDAPRTTEAPAALGAAGSLEGAAPAVAQPVPDPGPEADPGLGHAGEAGQTVIKKSPTRRGRRAGSRKP